MSVGGKRNADMSEATLTLRPLGEFIVECDERNEKGVFAIADVRGISINKSVINTKADMTGVSLSSYKQFKHNEFCVVTVTSRNGGKISLARNEDENTYIVSSSYVVFRIRSEELMPEFLSLLFGRSEFDRYARFNSWGSAREVFSYADMTRVEIPVPSIKVQRKVVEAWQGLRRMKEENEKLAEPLMQLCRSYLQDCKKKWPMKELGNYIEQRLEINRDGMYGECDARGVNTNKEIQICKRMGEDLTSYKIVHPFDIVYNANIKLTKETTKFAVGLYAGEHNVIVTNFYTVFSIKQNELLPEYLLLILSNDEFARYVKFISCSSVRDRFDFSDMCRVKIPLPPIEVQQAIVDVYRCANEAKKIADEADRLSREICPALIRWAAEGGDE